MLYTLNIAGQATKHGSLDDAKAAFLAAAIAAQSAGQSLEAEVYWRGDSYPDYVLSMGAGGRVRCDLA